MKNYLHLFTLTILVALIAVPVAAQFQGPTDTPTVPPNIEITPVAQAKALPDDAIVGMRGFILEQFDTDDFLFTDESDPQGADPNNVVKLEIEFDVFQGQTVTPTTKVTVVGKVDKDGAGVVDEIEVYYLVAETAAAGS